MTSSLLEEGQLLPAAGSIGGHLLSAYYINFIKRRTFRAPCCQASIFPYTTTIFEKCLVLAIGDLYATPTDFWRPGVAGPKFNIETNKVEALIVEYDSNVTFSFR